MTGICLRPQVLLSLLLNLKRSIQVSHASECLKVVVIFISADLIASNIFISCGQC
jgi:hypothetical protein